MLGEAAKDKFGGDFCESWRKALSSESFTKVCAILDITVTITKLYFKCVLLLLRDKIALLLVWFNMFFHIFCQDIKYNIFFSVVVKKKASDFLCVGSKLIGVHQSWCVFSS